MISNNKILVKGLHSAYVEPLNCVLPNSFSIQYEQNSNYQASFTAYNDKSIAFNLLTVESSIFWDNQEYIIKQITPDYSNGAETLQVTATHVAYEVQRVMQHEKKTGTLTYTVQDVLKFVLGGNSLGFTWEVIGTFEKAQITDLGNLNGKDMLSKITETWKDAIFYPDNKKIRIYKHDKLAKNYGNRIDYLHNTSSIKLSYESTNLVNQVKVFGKQKEQEGSSNDKIEYYFEPFIVENKNSIKKWGLHPGADVSDERFTDKNAMKTYALGQLQPEPTFTIDATEQTNEIPKVCEIRRLEVKPTSFVTTVEIVSFTYYPLDNSQATQITLNNKANTILNYQSSQQRKLQEALNKQKNTVNQATKTAKVAYSSRLAGHKVIETPAQVRTNTIPVYKLYIPEKNSGFQGLSAGQEFYPYVPADSINGLYELIENTVKGAISNLPADGSNNDNGGSTPTNNTILNGKIMNIIGDSYVANNGKPIEETWHYKIAKSNNMTYNNYGINGNGLVSDKATGVPVINRYQSMKDNADYILVVGGKNDYNQQIDISDFKKGIEDLIKDLTEKYIGKKVCFFTPWVSNGHIEGRDIELEEYANAIEDVCNTYSIPCFNSSKYSGIATYSTKFRQKYFQSKNDTSHLNSEGHDLFINKAQSFLESL